MMQGTETGAVVRQALVVDEGLAETTSAAARSVRALVAELQARDIHVVEALSCEDGLAIAVSDSGIHCILLNWTQGDNDSRLSRAGDAIYCARCARATPSVPIFLMASRKLAGTVSVEVATLADEFIWILDDTAAFIGGRVQAAIERYVQALLPPFAAALARYDREREYSWAAPGHQGGVAFLKSPDRPRVLRLLRREPVSHRHGHRARRARLAARPQRPDRRERALRRARVRRAPLVLGAERHLGVQPRDHVGVRRRRRDRALRPQLPQVDRAGSRDHRRDPGVPEPDAQPLRHHRADSPGAPRAQGDREEHRGQPARQGRGPEARGLLRAHELHLRRHVLRRGRTRRRGSRRASTASTSTRPGTATRASTRCTATATRCAASPRHHPKDGPTVFATHSTHKLLAALSQTSFIHIRDGRGAIDHGRFNEAYCSQASTSPLYALIASNEVAAAMMDGPAGQALTQETIDEAVACRLAVARARAGVPARRRTGSSRRGMPRR